MRIQLLRITTAMVSLSLALASAETQADVLLTYHDGTTTTSPTFEGAGITGGTITYANDDGFRTSFGGAGDTPAGVTAPTASGSNWRLWRKSTIDDSLTATANYAGFSFTVGAAADGFELDTLTFDLAAGAANGATGGLHVSYEIFGQVNGGGFNSLGGVNDIELLADSQVDQFSDVLTAMVDVSALGPLADGDIFDLRIGVASEDSVGAANVGLFMQGIELQGAAAAAVPEPTSIAIWSLIGLGLIGFATWRRRRATGAER